MARSAAVERHVTFAGLVDNARVARYCAAADLFVLPSLLEALPTVAVEALACGTPVVSSDNPGGVELHGVFGDDVAVVPKEQPAALAGAIRAALRQKRRTHPSTQAIVERAVPRRCRGAAVLRRSTAEVSAPMTLCAIGRAAAAAAARGAARRGVGGALLRVASRARDRVRSRSAEERLRRVPAGARRGVGADVRVDRRGRGRCGCRVSTAARTGRWICASAADGRAGRQSGHHHRR